MIIIDEQAETTLLQALKALPEPEGKFCIHFKATGTGDIRQLCSHLISTAGQYVPGAQLYCYRNEDVFLLTQHSSVKECRKLMRDATQAMQQPATDAADIYDLGVQTGVLMGVLEQKIQDRQKVNAEKERQQAEAEAVRRRQKILLAHASSSAEEINARRKKRLKPELMIVEDDIFSSKLVENVLQKQYEITSLPTAEYALAAYSDLAPDLLFLDINLPDVTGHELLERIIALDPQAYVVMLSGNADKTNIVRAMDLGAKGFVAKPFTREKILQYIQRCPTIQ